MLLSNDNIALRAMEPEDCEVMYRWENDTSLWELGAGVSRPFSRAALRQFIAEAPHDLHATGQLRLMVTRKENGKVLGCVDLFDFNPVERRAGVGILIYEAEDRGKGYGSLVLQLLEEYAFGQLGMRQLWATIPESNVASLRLFEKAGYNEKSLKRRWANQGEENAWFAQLIR